MSTILLVARATSQEILELRPHFFYFSQTPQWNDRYTITPPRGSKQAFLIQDVLEPEIFKE